MTPTRILIACVGNIFLGDDAFGVEVARRLARVELPDGVRAHDFGIRGLDLSYALMDAYEAVILVDATPRGGPPGTLYLIEPESGGVPVAEGSGVLIDMHAMDPVKVLDLVASMGGQVGRLLLVGCEPSVPEDAEDFARGLSEPVQVAVDEAVPLIVSCVTRLLAGEEIVASGVGNIPGKEVESCHE